MVRSWWVVFGLLIALPAAALAVFGLKAIRADEIERTERLRNERLRAVTLLDAAIDQALSQAVGIDVAVDRRGIIRFPQSRIYFGPFGLTPSDVADEPGAGRTPSGLPAAVVKAMIVSSQPIAEDALDSLRAGHWWLSIEQRKAYELELRSALSNAGGHPSADDHIPDLERIEAALRRSLGSLATATRAAAIAGGALLIWRGSESTDGVRIGVILKQPAVSSLLASALTSILDDTQRPASIVDGQNQIVWGEPPATGATTEAFSSVAGWRATFLQVESGATGSRRLLLYSLVLLAILVLASGLVMTASIVRREIALSSLRSQFVSAVTHEFKSPITSIRLVLERLTSGRVANTDPLSRYYAAMTAEVDRLEGLVNRLLESQKLQAGQKVRAPQPTSIRTLVEVAVGRVTPIADAKGIRIVVDSAAPVPDLDLDRESVTDAIGNLLDNAIKYSPANTQVSVGMNAADGQVAVTVADEGIGIDPADASKVFDAFFRSQRGDQASVQGTGLGLFLVRACAEGHGGTVDVSTSGPGSCFTLRFPIPGER